MILLKVPLEYFADGGESGKPFWDPERAVQAELFNCFMAGFPVNGMDEIQREVRRWLQWLRMDGERA